MIQRNVDATLLPQSYEVHVSDWRFVPTSSKTPDVPAYYIARVVVRSGVGEASEDAIVRMQDLAGDRLALDEFVRRTINVATLTAKARLDEAHPSADRFELRDSRSVA